VSARRKRRPADTTCPPLGEHTEADPARDRIAGELGEAVNFGWTCLGIIDDAELWGVVSVDEADVVDYLHARAKHFLPAATRYEIRRRVPTFYGRAHGLAWYRDASTMDAASEWGAHQEKPTSATEGGHYLVGQFITPNPP
jgi:hypothetical protein